MSKRKSKIPNSALLSRKVPYVTPNYENNEAVACVVFVAGFSRFIVNAYNGPGSCGLIENVNCSVPGKFKGRNRRRNLITVGTYVIATMNLRTSKKGKMLGEIVHLYPPEHHKQLLRDGFVLEHMNSTKTLSQNENAFDFDDEDAITFDDI